MAPRAFPKFIGVRVNETEWQLLDRLATLENKTISAMVRECIIRESVRPLFHVAERPRKASIEGAPA